MSTVVAFNGWPGVQAAASQAEPTLLASAAVAHKSSLSGDAIVVPKAAVARHAKRPAKHTASAKRSSGVAVTPAPTTVVAQQAAPVALTTSSRPTTPTKPASTPKTPKRSQLGQTVTDAGDGLGTTVSNTGVVLGGVVAPVSPQLGDLVKNATDAVGGVVKQATDLVGRVLDSLKPQPKP